MKFFYIFLCEFLQVCLIKIFLIFCCLSFSLTVFSKNCTYEFDPKHSLVGATGYKFTEKTGVGGKFSGFKLNKYEKKKNIMDLFKDLVVTVDLTTLDSGDSMRDKNIAETLFSGLSGGTVVTVSVEKVTEKTIETRLKINSVSQKVIFDYKINAGVLNARGRFDALEYAFGEQIKKFKKRCGFLHTGKDKKSVTWTDFDLSVTAKITEVCQ